LIADFEAGRLLQEEDQIAQPAVDRLEDQLAGILLRDNILVPGQLIYKTLTGMKSDYPVCFNEVAKRLYYTY